MSLKLKNVKRVQLTLVCTFIINFEHIRYNILDMNPMFLLTSLNMYFTVGKSEVEYYGLNRYYISHKTKDIRKNKSRANTYSTGIFKTLPNI